MDNYVPLVVERVPCGKHHVSVDEPCFLIAKGKGSGYYFAICNKRAKRAGFTAVPSNKSLRKT